MMIESGVDFACLFVYKGKREYYLLCVPYNCAPPGSEKGTEGQERGLENVIPALDETLGRATTGGMGDQRHKRRNNGLGRGSERCMPGSGQSVLLWIVSQGDCLV